MSARPDLEMEVASCACATSYNKYTLEALEAEHRIWDVVAASWPTLPILGLRSLKWHGNQVPPVVHTVVIN